MLQVKFESFCAEFNAIQDGSTTFVKNSYSELYENPPQTSDGDPALRVDRRTRIICISVILLSNPLQII
jgi:hypothetical protein